MLWPLLATTRGSCRSSPSACAVSEEHCDSFNGITPHQSRGDARNRTAVTAGTVPEVGSSGDVRAFLSSPCARCPSGAGFNHSRGCAGRPPLTPLGFARARVSAMVWVRGSGLGAARWVLCRPQWVARFAARPSTTPATVIRGVWWEEKKARQSRERAGNKKAAPVFGGGLVSGRIIPSTISVADSRRHFATSTRYIFRPSRNSYASADASPNISSTLSMCLSRTGDGENHSRPLSRNARNCSCI